VSEADDRQTIKSADFIGRLSSTLDVERSPFVFELEEKINVCRVCHVRIMWFDLQLFDNNLTKSIWYRLAYEMK